MIKAVVKTTLTEIPATCGVCPYKQSERMMNGDQYWFCRFSSGLYIEPCMWKKNPECPLVEESDDDNK